MPMPDARIAENGGYGGTTGMPLGTADGRGRLESRENGDDEHDEALLAVHAQDSQMTYRLHDTLVGQKYQ